MQAAGLSPSILPFTPTAMPNAQPPAARRAHMAFAQRDTFEPEAQKTATTPTVSAPPRSLGSTVLEVVCCPVTTVYDIFQLIFSVPCIVCCVAC